jgi:membrane-associated phospholipid phosphatase
MKDISRENRPFLIPYLLFLITGGIVLLLSEKKDLHLFFNSYHHPAADSFFTYITYLGDGVTANIVSSLITQGMKQLVFPDSPRPSRFFEGIKDLYLVPGVDVHSFYSFPSGHTTVAFTLYFCLALIARNKWLKGLLFLLSLTVSYSRIYLSQHFFSDVYAGSVIGVIVSLVVFYTIENSRRLKGQQWLDDALLKRTNKPQAK